MGEYMRTLLNGLKTWVGGEINKLRAKIEAVGATASKAASAANTAKATAIEANAKANTAQNAANTAQNAANTAQNAANTAQNAANTAQNAANTAQIKADAAQAAADNAQSSVNAKLDVIKSTTQVTISVGSVRYGTNVEKKGLNIATGSIITATSGNFSGASVWGGRFEQIRLESPEGVDGPVIQISLGNYDGYTISAVNNKYSVDDLTLTYDKAEIPKLSYSPTGVWLPPYVIIPCFYMVSENISGGSSNARKMFKVTVDDTGTLSATEVTS